MKLKLSDLEFQETSLVIKQGDGKKIKIQLTLNGKPMDLTNYQVRFAIKNIDLITELDQNMQDFFLDSGLCEIIDALKGEILLHIKPEISCKFPISIKENDTLILAIGVSNKEHLLSEEFLFKLIVKPSVLSSLY